MQMCLGLALNISASPFSSGPRGPGAISNSAVFPSHRIPVACYLTFPPRHLLSLQKKRKSGVFCPWMFLPRWPLWASAHGGPLWGHFSLHKASLETVILHLVGFSCRLAICSSESRSAESAQGDAFPKCKRTYLDRKPIQFLIYITYLHCYFHIGQARVLLHHAFASPVPPQPTHKALNECFESWLPEWLSPWHHDRKCRW